MTQWRWHFRDTRQRRAKQIKWREALSKSCSNQRVITEDLLWLIIEDERTQDFSKKYCLEIDDYWGKGDINEE